MNPYRLFYKKQAEWSNFEDLESVKKKHELRSKYYEWYTKNWLPIDKNSQIIDIGCGAGQFVYFLKKKGYLNAIGIDIDEQQVQIANDLGISAHVALAEDYLSDKESSIHLISMLDVIEHFTYQELYPLMESAYRALAPGGQIIVSVPNAVSPLGLSTRFSDITHETCFSPTTLSQMFFCHNMKIKEFRDPWPAPISLMHKGWRTIATIGRQVQSARMKLIGLSAPQYWSPVIWAVAQK